MPLAYFENVQLLFQEEEFNSNQFYFALPLLVFVVILGMGIFIWINIMVYYMIMGLLNLIKVESGSLNKNVAGLESITNSIRFYKGAAVVLTAAGILGPSLISKLKGLGGGSFGGSGSGGKW